jgi:hypothetical protein
MKQSIFSFHGVNFTGKPGTPSGDSADARDHAHIFNVGKFGYPMASLLKMLGTISANPNRFTIFQNVLPE